MANLDLSSLVKEVQDSDSFKAVEFYNGCAISYVLRNPTKIAIGSGPFEFRDGMQVPYYIARQVPLASDSFGFHVYRSPLNCELDELNKLAAAEFEKIIEPLQIRTRIEKYGEKNNILGVVLLAVVGATYGAAYNLTHQDKTGVGVSNLFDREYWRKINNFVNTPDGWEDQIIIHEMANKRNVHRFARRGDLGLILPGSLYDEPYFIMKDGFSLSPHGLVYLGSSNQELEIAKLQFSRSDRYLTLDKDTAKRVKELKKRRKALNQRWQDFNTLLDSEQVISLAREIGIEDPVIFRK